jgi:hypothetical protein
LKLRAKIFSDLLLRKHFLIGTLLVLVFCSSFAQINVKDLGTYLKQGDAKGLSKFFDSKIVITRGDETQTHSKNQSIYVLQRFFSNVEPNNFIQISHGGPDATKPIYINGNLYTSRGIYKLHLVFKEKKGKHIIILIQIDKQN